MTQLSPTALEAAAKAAFEAEWERPWETAASYERDHFHGVATAAITAYLAQMEKEGFVMVPTDTLAAIKSMLTIEAIAPAEHGFEREKRREAWGRIEAMLSAAQNGGE